VGVFALLYLVGINVLLRTRLLRNAISGPSQSFAVSGRSSALSLDYRSAYSLFPGRVHVEGLSIRGRDQNVEWLINLDRADVVVSLSDLLRRTFHATRVRSSGFAIRARLRLTRADATPGVVAALPPIEGFADPPLRDDEPESPPLEDAKYDLWMVDLEDVDVEHVREVWIHTIRSEGDTHVRGRWIFHPQRWLDVGPATVDANGVDIFYGSHPLATDLRGSSGATVHPFDLRLDKGLAIFNHVSYDGELRGRAALADVATLVAPPSGVRFTRCDGPLDSHMVLDHGRLADGTHVHSEATDCAVEAAGLVFEAPVRLELAVDVDLATAETRVSGVRVSRLGAQQARVASIAATLKSRHLQVENFFDDARFTLVVGGAETSNIGAWTRYLPSTSPLVIGSGLVTAAGHADGSLTEKWAVGAATVTAQDVTVQAGRARVAGKVAAHVDLRRATLADEKLDLSGSDVAVSDISVRSAAGGSAFIVSPAVTVTAPSLVLEPSGMKGHATIDLPAAELVDLGRLHELLVLPAALVLEGGRGRARLHADIDLGAGTMRGDGEIVTRSMRARAGTTELFGDLDCIVRARRSAGAGGVTDVSGSTLALSHAGTGKGAPGEDSWWGNIALRDATLRTLGGLRFQASAHVTAKDASPATAIVSQNSGVPTWAANIFRMPVLGADAQVRLAPAVLEVRSLVARGGGTSVRAEYAKRDGRQDGAVLLDLGWTDLGYDLADGSTGLIVFGPQAWYAHKVAAMSNAAVAAGHKAEADEQIARFSAMTPALRKAEARELAARCGAEPESCDGAAIESLLHAAADAGEGGTLSGIAYAPMVVAAAKGGKDGATLDPLVVGSVAEALKRGTESTLDHIAPVDRVSAAGDSGTARGRVIAVVGRVLSSRREGPYAVGTLTTDAEPIYFVTPFATTAAPETLVRFRGVFVQRYALTDQTSDRRPSLVLIGAFDP
jgi:hypothetical protein